MRLRRLTFLGALCALAAVIGYGIVSRALFEQPVWTPGGLQKLGWLAVSYAVVAGVFILWKPRWFGPVAIACGLIYAILIAGPAAVGTLALFLFSCYVLGRLVLRQESGDIISVLLGLSIYATAVGLAAHVRVNYAAVYVAAFLGPLAARPRVTQECARRIARLVARVGDPPQLTELPHFALLLFVLIVHLLVALKPEAGSDALAMHLTIPASVAQHHLWEFDFQHLVWAVMPMAGDWAYTAVYLPGSESAARLLNFAMLVLFAALLFVAMRRWAHAIEAYLAIALFCSSPVVQLETGSLFVENIWTALLVGALASLWEFHQTRAPVFLIAAGILSGAALQTKVGALAFVVPLGGLGIWALMRSEAPAKTRTAAIALLAFVLFAAPPYVNAYIKTGNPVFPFANALFRSPHFETTASFMDRRFNTPLAWDSLYSMTVDTGRYFEGQSGALGFHYLLLLPLLAWTVRRPKWPLEAWTTGGIAVLFFVFTFAAQSNLRYLYPALALSTVPIAWLFTSMRKSDRALYRLLVVAALAALALNIYFLPASGWYHKDFFLNPFDRDSGQRYLAETAPVRTLIEYMNQNHPGAPVMLIESSEIAGLHARGYSNSWHHHVFRSELLRSRNAVQVLRLMDRHEISYFIAPMESSGITIIQPALRSFLGEFTETEVTAGKYQLSRLTATYSGRDAIETLARGLMPIPPGAYDDTSPRISYSGEWTGDTQFVRAANGTLTYSEVAGDSLRLTFTGTEVTYVYTRALNRGIAEVLIDGASRAKLDLYRPETEWQASTTFRDLPNGQHVMEVRVLGEKNPRSSGTFVDVDRIVVR